MGYFNRGNIQWYTRESTGVEDHSVLEPTRGARVLDHRNDIII